MFNGLSARKEPELLGLALRSVRESKGMTRAELKQLMKDESCTEETIRAYEEDGVPMGVETFFAFTKALGITPNDLAPTSVMKDATSALGDYARLNGVNKRMVDQMIGLFLRQQRPEGGE